MNEDIIKNAVEKFPNLVQEPFVEIMDLIGYDGLCVLSKVLGGSVVYIPTKKRLFGSCISESIKVEFNGCNLRQLAKKYDLSERTIRNYIYGR